jgi:hypothetical protein
MKRGESLQREEVRLDPAAAAAAILVAMHQRVPVVLWSHPGVGKTALVCQIGERLGRLVATLVGSTLEATDIGGYPVLGEQGVEFRPPAQLARIAGTDAILFLDELTTSPPPVQAAMLKLVLDRRVGNLALGDRVAIVAAANPPESAADGYDLAPPMANRFCHLGLEAHPEVWIDGMLGGWKLMPLPELGDVSASSAIALVTGFIRARPELLNPGPPADRVQAGRAWPSPRSWDMATRLLAAADAVELRRSTLFALVAGCVGSGAATELLAYRARLNLPDPEALLAGEDSITEFASADLVFAGLAGLCHAVAANPTEERLLSAFEVVAKVAREHGSDTAVPTARRLIIIHNEHGVEWVPPAVLKDHAPLLRAAGVLS